VANLNPSVENLTPWQPGQSGNPGGYSSGRRITTALLKLIEEQGADNALALTWLAMAMGDHKTLDGRKPDFRFFKELLDRVEGKVPDKFTVDRTADVQLEWEDADAKDSDAGAASGPEAGQEPSGAIQGAGVREAMGEDPAGGGDLP
jgi:hypothetical protein